MRRALAWALILSLASACAHRTPDASPTTPPSVSIPVPSSKVPVPVLRAVARWAGTADVRVYPTRVASRRTVVAPVLLRSGDGWQGALVGLRLAGGRWSVVRTEPVPIDPDGSIGRAEIALEPMAWGGALVLGGFVDPGATVLRVLDARGAELARAEVVDGGLALRVDPQLASVTVLERDGALLAARSVPLLRPVPVDAGASSTGARLVRGLLERVAADPAPTSLAHPLAPPGLAIVLHRLLTATPEVAAIRGGAGSFIATMRAPGCRSGSRPAWCEAVVFLTVLPVGGEPRIVGFDYRPVR